MRYHEMLMIIAILLGVAATASGAERAYAGDEHHHHQAMAQAEAGYQRTAASYRIPDVRLVDMDGKPLSLRDGLG